MKFSKSIFTVDTHTCGEPTRIVISGAPFIPGNSMINKKHYMKEEMDYIRKSLMLEPRGHNDMFGAILTQPVNSSADLGVIFMENLEYLNMCGHGTIGVVTAVIELGFICVKEPFTDVILDTPAGLISARAKVSDSKVEEVTFLNVPAFLFKSNYKVTLAEVGEVLVDIAFGGNFFGIVSAKNLGIKVEQKNIQKLISLGMELKNVLNKSIDVVHPEKKYIDKIDLVEIYDTASSPQADLKNCVIFGDSQVDRSPCGTGTCAKMAILYSKGALKINENFIYESILGTTFKGKIVSETKVGNYRAIVPEITGSAYITGMHQFIIDERDPLKYGFSLK